jgi:hypothetical protein
VTGSAAWHRFGGHVGAAEGYPGVWLGADDLAGGSLTSRVGDPLPRQLDDHVRGDDVQARDNLGQGLPCDSAGLFGAQVAGQVIIGRGAWLAGPGLAGAYDRAGGL